MTDQIPDQTNQAPDIDWDPPRHWPEKAALVKAIIVYVRRHTGIANARLTTLDRVNVDDLTLVSMCMGYKPNETFLTMLRGNFDREDRNRVQQSAQWEVERQQREAKRQISRLTAQNILDMSDQEIRVLAGFAFDGEQGVEEQVAKVRNMITRLSDLIPPPEEQTSEEQKPKED